MSIFSGFIVFVIQMLRSSATVLASVRRRGELAWRDSWRWVLKYPDTLAAKAVNLVDFGLF